MTTITVQEIQQNPADFLHRIEAGEPLLVLKDQRPLAEVKPVPAMPGQLRPFGLCAGRIHRAS